MLTSAVARVLLVSTEVSVDCLYSLVKSCMISLMPWMHASARHVCVYDRSTTHRYQLGDSLGILQHVHILEQGVLFQGNVRILQQMAEVLRGNRIDDGQVLLPPHLVVPVEDTVVCQTLMDAVQTVEQIANVHQAAGKA